MKTGDVINALKRRHWIIIALIIIASLTGAVASLLQTPVYKVRVVLAAEAPVSPVTKNPDPSVTFAMAASMQSITNAAGSIEVAKATSSKLKESGINLSPRELQDRATASFQANTTALTIDFTDSSPTRVVEIANTWGEEASRALSDQPITMGGKLVLTNVAVPPNGPTMPKPVAYVGLGVVLGLVFGVSLAIGLEYFDPHFHSSEQTEEVLRLPVLGILPREHSLTPLSSNVYASIRTSLILSQEEGNWRSILVTSVIPNFEKAQGNIGAQVTAHLAASYANTGRETLLVDCDLSEGAVSKLLGAEGLAGLADMLEEKEPLDRLIANTDTANLYLLPAGSKPRIASDLLSSTLFQRILRGLEDKYDMVVLDGPPLILSLDSAIVAKSSKSSLLVIDARNCTRNSAVKALESFERFQIKPTGVILTNVKIKRL